MNASERFNAFVERSKETDAYWSEKAILEYTEELIAQMALKKMNRTELAKRIGRKNPAFVTKLLRGDNNFTFDTACRLARALDMEFVPHMKPRGWQTRWMDISLSPEKKPAESLGVMKREYKAPVESEIGEDHAVVALAS